MSHTLIFDWLMAGKHQVGQIARITEQRRSEQELTVSVWNVRYKDNFTVIVERTQEGTGLTAYPSLERRVYQVQQWTRVDQCQATVMR